MALPVTLLQGSPSAAQCKQRPFAQARCTLQSTTLHDLAPLLVISNSTAVLDRLLQKLLCHQCSLHSVCKSCCAITPPCKANLALALVVSLHNFMQVHHQCQSKIRLTRSTDDTSGYISAACAAMSPWAGAFQAQQCCCKSLRNSEGTLRCLPQECISWNANGPSDTFVPFQHGSGLVEA